MPCGSSADFFPWPTRQEGGRFFTRETGRLAATPLFIVLLVVETTDLVFALDSLPAVLAITKDGFVALTSNIFAILGLRSLYFALNGVMQLFRYLKLGLAVILLFIGVKMLIEPWCRNLHGRRARRHRRRARPVRAGERVHSGKARAPGRDRRRRRPGYKPRRLPWSRNQRSAARHAGQTSSTRRQNRAEWFISRRCINSWWMM